MRGGRGEDGLAAGAGCFRYAARCGPAIRAMPEIGGLLEPSGGLGPVFDLQIDDTSEFAHIVGDDSQAFMTRMRGNQ